MRAIVFSDSHGNYDVLERIMERHRTTGIFLSTLVTAKTNLNL